MIIRLQKPRECFEYCFVNELLKSNFFRFRNQHLFIDLYNYLLTCMTIYWTKRRFMARGCYLPLASPIDLNFT